MRFCCEVHSSSNVVATQYAILLWSSFFIKCSSYTVCDFGCKVLSSLVATWKVYDFGHKVCSSLNIVATHKVYNFSQENHSALNVVAIQKVCDFVQEVCSLSKEAHDFDCEVHSSGNIVPTQTVCNFGHKVCYSLNVVASRYSESMRFQTRCMTEKYSIKWNIHSCHTL